MDTGRPSSVLQPACRSLGGDLSASSSVTAWSARLDAHASAIGSGNVPRTVALAGCEWPDMPFNDAAVADDRNIRRGGSHRVDAGGCDSPL